MTREVDCISRQATINAIKRIHPVDTDYDCTLYDKVDVMYVLDEIPSVIPQEPKTGHWIDSSNGWMCSECNNDNTYDTNYCPNCGAKMDKEQNNDK